MNYYKERIYKDSDKFYIHMDFIFIINMEIKVLALILKYFEEEKVGHVHHVHSVSFMGVCWV